MRTSTGVRELTSIGAGHAADAFARIVGRPCRMRVPTVRLLRSEALASTFVASIRDDERESMCGVFFERGGRPRRRPRAPLPARFARARRARAPRAGGAVVREAEESALRELGNMLVSHAVSAMADTLGTRVLPSIPVLAMEDALTALGSLVAMRYAGGAALRVETEISDAEGRYRGLLVYVPDPASFEKRPAARRSAARPRG